MMSQLLLDFLVGVFCVASYDVASRVVEERRRRRRLRELGRFVPRGYA